MISLYQNYFRDLKNYVQSKSFEASALDQDRLENHLDEAYKRDQETFEFINSSVRSAYGSWIPNHGRETCDQLHWSLCPNMCVIQDNLEVDFQDIRGIKMEQFREFENDLKERKDRIINDLEGKTYKIHEDSGIIKSEQEDLEKLEDAFIIQSRNPRTAGFGDRPVRLGLRFSKFCWSSPRFGHFSQSWSGFGPWIPNSVKI